MTRIKLDTWEKQAIKEGPAMNCKAILFSSNFHSPRCSREAVKDGYCELCHRAFAERHFDQAVTVLRELCETSLDIEIVQDHARAVLNAIDKERNA